MSKLKKSTKLGYGLGDLASNLVFQLSVIYLLFFYTDVLKIPAITAGTIFLIARLWDAVNDPVMGLVVDHTKSKHGKARVYILYGSFPLAIATMLMFFAPNLGLNAKIAYALITYIIWGMLYTLVNIPYSLLTFSLTNDPQERTSLSSIRMIFMLIGVIIVAVLADPIISMFDQAKFGYLAVAVIFSLAAFVFFQICFVMTKSAKDDYVEKKESYKIKSILPLLIKNDQLIVVTLASLLGSMAVFIRETSAIYYVTYNLGDGSLLPLFLGFVVLSMVLGNLVIPYVTLKFDKKGTYLIGSVIALVGSIAFHFVSYDNIPMVIFISSISSFGIAAISTIGWSMVPDTVEYGLWKSGVRTEGIIYAVYSFSQKLATALTGMMVAVVLEFSGYVDNLANQSEKTLDGIRSTLTIIPVVFIIISMVIILFYKIDKNTFEKIKVDLKNREIS